MSDERRAAGDSTVHPRVAIDAVRVTLELTREEARDLELYAERFGTRNPHSDLTRLRAWRKLARAIREARAFGVRRP